MKRLTVLMQATPLILGLLTSLTFGTAAGAQTQSNMTQVDPGKTVEIVAHGVCRRVHNGDTLTAMVPHASPEEWVSGAQSSFLSNVPEKMVATVCVEPEIALRRWSRPGPPGSDLQPFLINGSDSTLIFTSIGAASRGGTVSLDEPGNRISYTPPSEFWALGYLDEEEDVVPFQAIDAEGVTVSGTLRVRLVGWQSKKRFRAVRYYSPKSNLDIVAGDFSDLSRNTGPNNRFNSLYFFNEVLFDGQLSVHGLMSVIDPVSHVIMIDNSQSANATYSGGEVGNMNSDAWSNTILDAQLRAARDFVETLLAQNQAAQEWATITDGPTSAQISYLPDTGSITQHIRVYAVNSGANYVGIISGATPSEVRNSADAVLGQIQRTSNQLRMADVLTGVEAAMVPIVPDHFAMALYLLSPGVNSGGAPTNLSRFNTVTEGNFGTPIFAFYTGSNPSSPAAAFMAGLDRYGSTRHMSNTDVFGTFDHPNPIAPLAAPTYWNGSDWSFMRDASGKALYQFGDLFPGRKTHYRFSFRILPGTDLGCTWGGNTCFAEGVTPKTLENFSGFDSTDGALNYFRMQFEFWRNPVYRIHNDRYADFYNNGDILVLRNSATLIEGDFTPLPPEP